MKRPVELEALRQKIANRIQQDVLEEFESAGYPFEKIHGHDYVKVIRAAEEAANTFRSIFVQIEREHVT